MSAADDFLQHAYQLADQAGVELDDDDLRDLFEESHRGGFNVNSTESAFAALFDDDADDYEDDDEPDDDGPDDDEPTPGQQALADDLSDDLERLSKRIGRPLLDDEIEKFARNATEQINRTGIYSRDEAGAEFKPYGEMSSDQVNATMVARARQLDPPDDTEKVYEIGSDDRLVRNQAWTDYMVDRVNGASEDDFEAVDATVEEDEAA